MEGVRKVVAIVLGIIVLIGIILVARWTGEQIRQKFFAPKPTVVVTVPAPVPTPENPDNLLNKENQVNQLGVTKKTTIATATASAIPKTGPEELGYFLIGFLIISGFSSLTVARRLS